MEDKTETEKKYIEEEVADEEDDLDDGPPPGFQSIISTQPIQAMFTEVDEDDEGPPPGFHSITLKPSQPTLFSDKESSEQKDVAEELEEEDGPPPGWELFPLANALPRTTSEVADFNLESQEELNEHEGPPPGWETLLDKRMPPTSTPPPLPSSSFVTSDAERGSTQKTNGNIDDRSQPESQSTTLMQQSSPSPLVPQSTPLATLSSPLTPQMKQLSTSASPDESGRKVDIKNGSSISGQDLSQKYPPPPAQHPPKPNAASSFSEKAQLVCGICLKLLLYPRGAKHVQCSGCQEVNFVLEAHEVGQVKCGNCSILLMYPYGAPAVQCTSCRSVTEIGVSNMRPPLSVQQAQRPKRPIKGRRIHEDAHIVI